MKTTYFESISGNKSSSRVIGFVVVIAGLIFAQEVIILGKADIVQASIAAGTLFLTIAGPAMAFLFYQKRNEQKQESNQNPGS